MEWRKCEEALFGLAGGAPEPRGAPGHRAGAPIPSGGPNKTRRVYLGLALPDSRSSRSQLGHVLRRGQDSVVHPHMLRPPARLPSSARGTPSQQSLGPSLGKLARPGLQKGAGDVIQRVQPTDCPLPTRPVGLHDPERKQQALTRSLDLLAVFTLMTGSPLDLSITTVRSVPLLPAGRETGSTSAPTAPPRAPALGHRGPCTPGKRAATLCTARTVPPISTQRGIWVRAWGPGGWPTGVA